MSLGRYCSSLQYVFGGRVAVPLKSEIIINKCFLFLFFFKRIFIYFWLSGLSCGTWALRCTTRASLQLWCAGSRARGLCSLWHVGSLVEVHELSSCGGRAYLPRRMWDLSSPTRDRTHVPALEGGFFTTGPPGSLNKSFFLSVGRKETKILPFFSPYNFKFSLNRGIFSCCNKDYIKSVTIIILNDETFMTILLKPSAQITTIIIL